mgnify:FL=1
MWKSKLKGFNETKLFFFHGPSQTTIKYIDGDVLLGVEMYRASYTFEQWFNHFQAYLDTGKFDNHSYWVKYNTVRIDGKLESTYETYVNKVPMEINKDQNWDIHSKAFTKFMKKERLLHGDLGFKQVGKPK